MADGRFDDLLLGLAKQHKDVEELNYSILSFFERRTDLFHVMETSQDRMGFAPGAAEKMLMKQFRFFQHKHIAQNQPHLLGDRSAASGEAVSAAAVSGSAKEGDSSAATSGGYGSSSAAAAAEPATSAAAPADASAPVASAGKEEVSEQAAEAALPEGTRRMMRHISTWNGAVTDKYHWSQSIADVTIEVEVEKDTKAKDIKVDLTATRLSIKCKGQTVLEGKLHEKVNFEDSIWHMDDNKVILCAEKQRQTWWKCVLEGDEEIDTTKVESTRAMESFDGETQGAIRKIMFDQHQKAMGKPSSDQLRTASMMKDAWNAPGSPFRGSDFDPTLLNLSGPVPEDFFEDIEKKRLEAALAAKEADKAAASGAS
eukprot:TRINITY_DN56052_c0_g1_i1.p1 TRINITY_DN56052_c0_g1~~TRINITY_DN56052_c0_g1_i1.p1  ORF type:complete len:370 (-),score=75.03 TRINITY_DN56052_c0_g1_i1:150-1259(-)